MYVWKEVSIVLATQCSKKGKTYQIFKNIFLLLTFGLPTFEYTYIIEINKYSAFFSNCSFLHILKHCRVGGNRRALCQICPNPPRRNLFKFFFVVLKVETEHFHNLSKKMSLFYHLPPPKILKLI